MLRVTEHDEADGWRLELEGRLAGDWTKEAERLWARAPVGKPRLVDLRGVTCADVDGRDLLHRMHRDGARFIAGGVVMKALVEELRSDCFESAAMVVKVIGAALLTVVASTSIARAQTSTPPETTQAAAPASPTTPALRLTLQQAVSMGLRQSPEVAIANLNLAAVQEHRTGARAALLPQLALNVNEKVTRASVETVFGRRVEGFADHVGPFWAFQAGAGGSAPIFDLALWNTWRAAKEDVDASEADQTSTQELNAELVVSQYLGSLRASADVEAVRTRLDLAKALLDLATDMQRNGVGTSLDTLRANVEYQNELQRRTQAESQLSIALQGLRRLLSLNPDQPIELADAASFFETPAIAVDSSLDRAYAQRPEMQAILARGRAARFLLQSARSERLPKLALAGGWSYEGLRPDTAIPTYQFGAYASMPIFTGGRIGAAIATEQIQIRTLTEEERRLRDQIGFEVRAAVTRLDSTRSEVGAATLGVSLAREALSQAQDRFRAGVANNIEVITAQDALSRANDNQISALYRYNQARADLARSTGQMQSTYGK
jgi:outer membrane protein TolC